MAVQRKKLRVLPNPWLHIDEKGRPAGTVRLEQPGDGSFIHGWVGANVATVTEVEPAKRIKVEGRVFEQKPGIHYVTFRHSEEAVTVDNTPYYRKRVFSGDLIAFDEATAIACGISKASFVKPEELLEQIKAAAIKQFDSENGEGAFETLADMAAEEAEMAERVSAAVAEGRGEVVSTELKGVTIPADGVARTVDVEAIPGQAELAPIATDASGNSVMTEQQAPALEGEPTSRSKNRKGSDQ
jgi:hypothetical protein